MNLEPIDTSTTAGKARAMQLAAEGRRVAARWRQRDPDAWFEPDRPEWDWVMLEYAIIAEPVGPDEVWVVIYPAGGSNVFEFHGEAEDHARRCNAAAVRYRRVEE